MAAVYASPPIVVEQAWRDHGIDWSQNGREGVFDGICPDCGGPVVGQWIGERLFTVKCRDHDHDQVEALGIDPAEMPTAPPSDDTPSEPIDLGAYQAAAGESCAALLGEIIALLRRFVVMSGAQGLVVALWVVHSYLFKVADATGYLAVTSPEKRSGKTRLLEVLDLLVARPWFTGRTTAAVLPRKIDADSPTLLLDESDAAFNGDKEYSEALRGVLNTGHRRGGKTTVCVGQGPNIGFKDFATFCPKAIAGIGKLPDTVADRAIPIRLERRAPGERVDRFRRREVEPQTTRIRERLEALVEIAEPLLKDTNPVLPDELDDRAMDGVEPLLAIAELAGGNWPVESRAAVVELYGGRQIDDESTGVQLLSDIREVFGEAERITSAALLEGLHDLDESPWGDWFGKPLANRGLSRLLKPYAIKSRSIKLPDGKTPKGFLREQFGPAWARYLPQKTPLRHNPHSKAENSESESATEPSGLRIENRRNPAPQAEGGGVADRNPQETLGAAWDRLEREQGGEA
jgi:Protein of unknown function (DUF3631)